MIKLTRRLIPFISFLLFSGCLWAPQQNQLYTSVNGFYPPIVPSPAEDEIYRRIYGKSLAALKNVIDVRDELRGHLEDIADQEHNLVEKKKELKKVVKDIDNLFPPTKVNLSAQVRGLVKKFNEVNKEALYAREYKEVTNHKPSKAAAIGIISGVALSAIVGIVLWKGRGSAKRESRGARDDLFIRQITSYLERVA